MDDLFASADAADHKARANVRVAFVSTNSITQGEQVGVLWGWLLAQGIHIQFAHRTFQWSNDAPGKAAVHCVIVGFGLEEVKTKRLFEYADIKGVPHEVAAKNINPYLVDAPDALIGKRSKPIGNTPEMMFCSKPTDGGFLLLSDEEKGELLAAEPAAQKWIKRFVMGNEFINNIDRWCLWLKDISPSELKALPKVRERTEQVAKFRAKSPKAQTRELAKLPTLFGELRQPTSGYLAIPKVSSERREFIPIDFLPADVICGDKVFAIQGAGLYEFGIVTSTMHMAWMRQTCGRMKSDYSYANTIAYNNFPWPSAPSDTAKQRIEAAAQGVLDARAQFPGTSLATLYNPETMPPALAQAHVLLDRAVDAAYVPDGGAKSYASDAERVAFLFRRYAELTSLV